MQVLLNTYVDICKKKSWLVLCKDYIFVLCFIRFKTQKYSYTV